MTTPPLERRTFLARLLTAVAGGAWLGQWFTGRAEAATTQAGEGPFLGEIRMWAGSFEPYGWRFCNGQLLAISEYETLFNLIGTTYGGDGQVTFALPDLRGRAPIHVGTTQWAEIVGQEEVYVSPSQSPLHTHNLQGSVGTGLYDTPGAHVPAKNALGAPHYSATADTPLASTTLQFEGASLPHNNMMPSLGIHFIICVDFGYYPSPF